MIKGRISVLLVEDDKFDRMAVERHVLKMDLPYDLSYAVSQAEAQARLAEKSYDVVLLDYLLGDGTGLDLLAQLDDTPAIVVTGAGSEEVAIEAMRKGAYDYLIKDPNGNFLTVLPLTITTVIERKRAEQALRASEARYRGLSEFANSVLHNVGNVLNSIAASSEMIRVNLMQTRASQLKRLCELIEEHHNEPFLSQHPKGSRILPYLEALDNKLGEERHEMLAEANGILKNLQLIRDIVDTQQAQEAFGGPLTTCGLEEVLTDALKVSRSHLENGQIEVDLSISGPINLKVHRATLTHILINLIKNAADAVLANPEDDRRVRVLATLEGSSATLDVTDNGVGISKEHQEKLFTHGFTTKPGGHGFGLYYCANAMHDMGGAIEVISEGLGKGTTIRLIFNPTHLASS